MSINDQFMTPQYLHQLIKCADEVGAVIPENLKAEAEGLLALHDAVTSFNHTGPTPGQILVREIEAGRDPLAADDLHRAALAEMFAEHWGQGVSAARSEARDIITARVAAHVQKREADWFAAFAATFNTAGDQYRDARDKLAQAGMRSLADPKLATTSDVGLNIAAGQARVAEAKLKTVLRALMMLWPMGSYARKAARIADIAATPWNRVAGTEDTSEAAQLWGLAGLAFIRLATSAEAAGRIATSKATQADADAKAARQLADSRMNANDRRAEREPEAWARALTQQAAKAAERREIDAEARRIVKERKAAQPAS